MNTIFLISIIVVVVFAVLGFFIGLGKGFSEVRTWSSELVLSAVVTCLVAYYTKDSLSYDAYFFVVLATCVVSILLFVIIDRIMKSAFGDGKGGVDRFFGGVALLIKGATIATLILGFILIIMNMALPMSSMPDGASGITLSYYEFIDSNFWTKFGPILFDTIVIGIILSSFRAGYEHGVLSALWGIVEIVLVIGCVVGAYLLAFQANVFMNIGDSIGANLNMDLGESMSQIIGRAIMAVIIFVVLLVIVVTICIIVSRAIRHARDGATVTVVDGIFGGLILGAICIVVLMFVGAFLTQYYSPYSEIEEITFIDGFIDTFVRDGTFTSIFFTHNILLDMQSMVEFFRNISLIEHMV